MAIGIAAGHHGRGGSIEVDAEKGLRLGSGFDGVDRCAEGAVGAVSDQSLRGLQSGTQCEIDLRPQLEIYVDAVKAAHGATVGKLDEQMLFYLMSRGLDRDTAQGLLKWAFVADVLTRLATGTLRSQIEAELARHMGDAPNLLENLGLCSDRPAGPSAPQWSANTLTTPFRDRWPPRP